MTHYSTAFLTTTTTKKKNYSERSVGNKKSCENPHPRFPNTAWLSKMLVSHHSVIWHQTQKTTASIFIATKTSNLTYTKLDSSHYTQFKSPVLSTQNCVGVKFT
jgi:hypothetical protein